VLQEKQESKEGGKGGGKEGGKAPTAAPSTDGTVQVGPIDNLPITSALLSFAWLERWVSTLRREMQGRGQGSVDVPLPTAAATAAANANSSANGSASSGRTASLPAPFLQALRRSFFHTHNSLLEEDTDEDAELDDDKDGNGKGASATGSRQQRRWTRPDAVEEDVEGEAEGARRHRLRSDDVLGGGTTAAAQSEELADVVAAVLDARAANGDIRDPDGQRVLFVSWGPSWLSTMKTALRNPDATAGLVLVDPMIPMGTNHTACLPAPLFQLALPATLQDPNRLEHVLSGLRPLASAAGAAQDEWRGLWERRDALVDAGQPTAAAGGAKASSNGGAGAVQPPGAGEGLRRLLVLQGSHDVVRTGQLLLEARIAAAPSIVGNHIMRWAFWAARSLHSDEEFGDDDKDEDEGEEGHSAGASHESDGGDRILEADAAVVDKGVEAMFDDSQPPDSVTRSLLTAALVIQGLPSQPLYTYSPYILISSPFPLARHFPVTDFETRIRAAATAPSKRGASTAAAASAGKTQTPDAKRKRSVPVFSLDGLDALLPPSRMEQRALNTPLTGWDMLEHIYGRVMLYGSAYDSTAGAVTPEAFMPVDWSVVKGTGASTAPKLRARNINLNSTFMDVAAAPWMDFPAWVESFGHLGTVKGDGGVEAAAAVDPALAPAAASASVLGPGATGEDASAASARQPSGFSVKNAHVGSGTRIGMRPQFWDTLIAPWESNVSYAPLQRSLGRLGASVANYQSMVLNHVHGPASLVHGDLPVLKGPVDGRREYIAGEIDALRIESYVYSLVDEALGKLCQYGLPGLVQPAVTMSQVHHPTRKNGRLTVERVKNAADMINQAVDRFAEGSFARPSDVRLPYALALASVGVPPSLLTEGPDRAKELLESQGVSVQSSDSAALARQLIRLALCQAYCAGCDDEGNLFVPSSQTAAQTRELIRQCEAKKPLSKAGVGLITSIGKAVDVLNERRFAMPPFRQHAEPFRAGGGDSYGIGLSSIGWVLPAVDNCVSQDAALKWGSVDADIHSSARKASIAYKQVFGPEGDREAAAVYTLLKGAKKKMIDRDDRFCLETCGDVAASRGLSTMLGCQMSKQETESFPIATLGADLGTFSLSTEVLPFVPQWNVDVLLGPLIRTISSLDGYNFQSRSETLPDDQVNVGLVTAMHALRVGMMKQAAATNPRELSIAEVALTTETDDKKYSLHVNPPYAMQNMMAISKFVVVKDRMLDPIANIGLEGPEVEAPYPIEAMTKHPKITGDKSEVVTALSDLLVSSQPYKLRRTVVASKVKDFIKETGMRHEDE
jgi:hypothetical protein